MYYFLSMMDYSYHENDWMVADNSSKRNIMCTCDDQNKMIMSSQDIPRLLWRGGGKIASRSITKTRSNRTVAALNISNICSPVCRFGPCSFTRLLFSLLVLFSFQVSVLDAQCSETTDCHPPAIGLVTENIVTNLLSAYRSLEVTSTCGPTTGYRKSSLTFDDTLYYCWANNNSHPAIAMLDRSNVNFDNFQLINPQLQSYYQSENTIPLAGANPREQLITFNLTDSFLIRYIRIIFLSPHILTENDNSDMRPLAMVIEKFNVQTSAWQPLRYYAVNCSTNFPGVPSQSVDGTGPSYGAQVAVCLEKYYGGDTRTFSGWGFGRQEVQFAPSREFGQEFQNNEALNRYYSTNMIRLKIVRPSDDQPLSSYIAIADADITGHCSCFGHSSSCAGLNENTCNCDHNTQGDHCEECEPLFNNQPWRMGANNLANACEDCGCNNHAISCHYDAGKAYGVCDNCTLNTAGDKCEFCVDFYYVNPLKDEYANGSLINPGVCSGYDGSQYISLPCDSWCIPCNCSLEGSAPGSGYNCQNYTGQCFCKQNVQARACDECVDGFWNLTATNPLGCRACTCDQRGTIDNSNLCDKFSGDCVCKNNTQSKNCGQCKEGFWGISTLNAAGCDPCDCDPGASFNIICPVFGGICDCRSLIGGRTCKTPAFGNFVPSVDHLTYDAEFATNATNTFALIEKAGHGELNGTVTGRGYIEMPPSSTQEFSVTVPRTFEYNVVLRYSSPTATWSSTLVTFVITNPASAGITQYGCGGANFTLAQQHQITQVLSQSAQGAQLMGSVCLAANIPYTATINVGTPSTANTNLNLDSLVLLPKMAPLEFWSNLDTTEQTEAQTCYNLAMAINLEDRANLSCSAKDYSVMANLYNGAIPCSCSGMGSTSLVCDAYGGQCPCKPGVMLQDCSQCKVDHYGFQGGSGCFFCNCHPEGSVKSACNESGLCECKGNVTGSKCASCIPEYYGLFTGNGCEPCTCHANYSLNNQCADSGQCACKPGIGGLECDQCADGFYNLTTDGCTPCGCNIDGSGGGTCNKQTGVCICKANTQGEKCDECRDGFFGLGQWSADGCLPCTCSGHSSNCSSAEGFKYDVIRSTWNLLDGLSAVEGNFGGLDETGNPIDVSAQTKIVGTTAEKVMRIVNEGQNLYAQHYYYNATLLYLSSKQGGYGLNLTVSLTLRIPPQPPNTTVEYINSTDGDIIIQGKWGTDKLVAWLPFYPTEDVTTYAFVFEESNWRINSAAGPTATYAQLSTILADIGSIFIRAKFTNATDAITDLHAFEMYFTSPNGTLGGSANNVEQCVCPDAYTDQFCENCAPGYTRSVPFTGPYTECSPCSCNGHETGPNSCDRNSGICSCTHNTTGDYCGTCVAGYYGDATVGSPGDCKPCLCPGNAIANEVNSFASLCQAQAGGSVCVNCSEGHGGDHCEFCIQNYYGTPANATNNNGRCVPCKCNSRADTCDSTTGICTDCRNNTAGKECEICAPKYFGNAMNYDCKECNCTKLGATGDCDHRTGQCVCKPHVTGFECDQCAALSFNYSSGLGCELCDCHPTGSLTNGCDVISGQCLCNIHVAGRRCDKCEDTYWRINPTSGCDPCQCTALGTKNQTNIGKTFGTCELVTGQCECAVPGIIGRTCDHCAKGTLENFQFTEGVYLGTYPDCELCGECYDNWARKIDEVGFAILDDYNRAVVVWAEYDNMNADDVAPTLNYILGNLTDIDSSIVTAMDMVNKLNYLRDGFTTVIDNVTYYGLTLDELQSDVSSLSAQLRGNQLFVGLIQVNGTTTRTPAQIEADTLAVQGYYDGIYTEANSTWASIQNYTEIITASNGSAKILQARVNEALSQLSQARRDRVAAEMIVNGSFAVQYQNYTGRLDQIKAQEDTFDSTFIVARNQLTQAETLSSSANTTANEAEAIRAAKAGDVEAKLEQAQITKFNATQAQTAGQVGENAVNNYLSLATSTFNDMTSALEGIANGITTLINIDTEVGTGNALRQNISATSLRPFTAMQAITAQIETTSISAESVAKTFASATAGLQIAQEALNITKTASDASNKVLSQVRGIQSDLSSAKATRLEVNQLETLNTNLNNTIRTAVDSVNTKASNAITLAQTTNGNIDSSTAFINAIEADFVTELNKASAAKTLAQQANATASLGTLTHTANVANLANLTNSVSSKRQVVDSASSEMNQINADLKLLEADLAALDQITNLQRMQNEFAAQKSEMQSLDAQLNALEGELDTLISQLEQFAPDTTTCTHS